MDTSKNLPMVRDEGQLQRSRRMYRRRVAAVATGATVATTAFSAASGYGLLTVFGALVVMYGLYVTLIFPMGRED